MKPYLAWAVAVALLVCGCSLDRTSGGTAETENAVLAREFRVDSLLPHWNRPTAPTVATLRLDSTNFDFSGSDPAGRDIDIRRADGMHVPFEILQWDISLRRGRLRARIGTDLMSPGAKLGLWRGLALADRSDPVGVWNAIPDSLRLDLTSVLVDDFETENSKTSLPDSSTWFLGVGSGTGIVLAGGGRSGRALKLVSASTGSGSAALAAALLASTPRSLRTIDSIVFWAKGQGAARAAMEHATAGSQLVAWKSIATDTSWQRYRVVPNGFDSAVASGGASWSAIRDSLTHISFWMTGSGELWVDDLRIFGIDRDDLR